MTGRDRSTALHTVTIAGIAAGGEGVGRLADGRAVFVHRTAPGDRVRVALVDDRRRWARARLVAVLSPSRHRRPAPCPFYDRCGGCSLQHLSETEQRAAKAGIVVDAIRRLGDIDVDRPEVVASPAPLHYRNRLSFALRRLGGGRVVAGFHAVGRPGRIVDVDGRCMLGERVVTAAWDEVRRGWGPGAARLPAGPRLRLTVRAADGGDADLVVEGGSAPGEPDALLAHVPSLRSVWWTQPGRSPALLAGRDRPGAGPLVAPTAFSQTNPGVAALLEPHVLAAAGPLAGRRVVEGYCGTGVVARRLAAAGATVVGIEIDAAAVERGRRTAAAGLTLECGPVEQLLPAALPADVVIVDPPRTGLAAAVTEALTRTPPERMVYVSCDPATLARDLRRLEPVLAPADVTCFDMFPQTAEVETVVTLHRRIS